MLNLQLIKIR